MSKLYVLIAAVIGAILGFLPFGATGEPVTEKKKPEKWFRPELEELAQR